MNIEFTKYEDGLVPAIIQDTITKKVLMLGFMNEDALEKTQKSKKVTFYSRTKKRLWTKGEESGNFLNLNTITLDCDNDSLLIQVTPVGPICHKGMDTCWGEENKSEFGFISSLEKIIESRKISANYEESYVASLFAKGINKIAQKVGEEAVEVVIEAKDDNDDLFLDECADLLFHYLILLNAKGFTIDNVVNVLKKRQ
jgi:phosphoribosyl-ATP pyrophosphohydrolase/phosphoribosyl-AMP cyclohydrolase